MEDILEQDPREKVEIFPRLGYYLVIRSVDLNKYLDVRDLRTDDTCPQNEGFDTLNVTNVYLTVFREGICSVSKHNKVLGSPTLIIL